MPWEAVGAFLAGAASIAGAGFTLSRMRRRDRQECEERLAEVKASYEAGLTVGLGMERRRRRG